MISLRDLETADAALIAPSPADRTFTAHSRPLVGVQPEPEAIPQTIDPMEGGEISAAMSEGELILSGGDVDGQGARVIGFIPAENGVVHVINSVLMPEYVRDAFDQQPRG